MQIYRIAVALALLTACGSSEQPPKASEPAPAVTNAPEAKPDGDWFKQAMARELPPTGSTVTITGPDFVATVEGQGEASVTPMGDNTYVKWRLGGDTEVEVECVVYPKPLDLAASLVSIAHELWNVAEDILGKLDRKAVINIDAGSWGEVPYLRLDYAYRTLFRGEPRVGVLKQIITRRDGRSIYCRHNEPGYDQAFMRVAGAFMRDAKLEPSAEGAPEEPVYKSISVTSLNGKPVGVSEYTISSRQAGYRIVNWESTLSVRAADTVIPRDSYTIELTNHMGDLEKAVEVAAMGKEMDKNLKLAMSPEGKWVVTGVIAGQELQAELPVEDVPSGIEYYRSKRQFLQEPKQGETWSIATWIPSVDPVHLTTSTLTVLGVDDEQIAAETKTGELAIQSKLDIDGDIRQHEVSMGDNTLHIVRVHREGQYP